MLRLGYGVVVTMVIVVCLYGMAQDAGLLEPAAAAPRTPPAGESRLRPGPANQAARADIPRRYLTLYQHAATGSCLGRRNWQVLGGIGKVESNHGRSRLPGVRSGQNFAGAAGPMQIGNGTGRAGNSWARYGRGGNIYDPRDAIPAAARYLCGHGARGNLRGAVFGYNHDWGYVATVFRHARRYGWRG
jgi:hypothetical protein